MRRQERPGRVVLLQKPVLVPGVRLVDAEVLVERLRLGVLSLGESFGGGEESLVGALGAGQLVHLGMLLARVAALDQTAVVRRPEDVDPKPGQPGQVEELVAGSQELDLRLAGLHPLERLARRLRPGQLRGRPGS